MITKKAQNKDTYKREWIYTDSARNAWSDIIEKYKLTNPNGKILLPGYIGWSANEGSGIFDSVVKSGLEYDFYDLDDHLKVDFEHLKQKVKQDPTQLVLLVHYFGFIDSRYDEITSWLINNKIFFVEDSAHAWLTDLIGGACGRKGAFSFYSLHKLLPLSEGGIMVNNTVEGEKNSSVHPFFELGYDLHSIYSIRRYNFNYLTKLLKNVNGITLIYNELGSGICPQTLPVSVDHYDRDALYHKMNEAGFGMVSLYHTMISQLENSTSKAASILAGKIINFPIHQDVTEQDMEDMIIKLKEILNA